MTKGAVSDIVPYHTDMLNVVLNSQIDGAAGRLPVTTLHVVRQRRRHSAVAASQGHVRQRHGDVDHLQCAAARLGRVPAARDQ